MDSNKLTKGDSHDILVLQEGIICLRYTYNILSRIMMLYIRRVPTK